MGGGGFFSFLGEANYSCFLAGQAMGKRGDLGKFEGRKEASVEKDDNWAKKESWGFARHCSITRGDTSGGGDFLKRCPHKKSEKKGPRRRAKSVREVVCEGREEI